MPVRPGFVARRSSAVRGSPSGRPAGGRPPGGPRPVPAEKEGRAVHLDAYRLCLFGLILIALSRIHLHFGLTNFRLGLVLAAAAMAVAFFAPHLVNTRQVLRFWPSRVIVGLGVAACLSAAFGISLGGSATYILQDYAKVLLLFFLLQLSIRDVRDLRLLVWAYVLSCAVLAYYALFVFELRQGSSPIARLGGMYTFDANDVGCILLTGFPLAILLFQTSGAKGRIAAGTTLLGIGATIALTGSRGTFLGLVVVGLLLLVFVPGVSAAKRIGFLAVVGTALTIFAPQGYWDQMATLLEPKEDYNWTEYYGRRQTWDRALGYFADYPVFGVGINNFARADATLSERGRNFVDRTGHANRWRAVHNSFLQAAVETGTLGLVLWSAMIFGGIVGVRRLRRRLHAFGGARDPTYRFLDLAALYVPISLGGFAATSFFLTLAWADIVYILMAIVAGLYICTRQFFRTRGPAPLRAAASPAGAARAAGAVRPRLARHP